MPLELFFVISLALLFDFLNGVHDSSNIVATMIASRAFRPGTALGLTAVANFLGPFLFGVAVATTIGDEVAQSNALSIVVIIACLVGAIVWNVLTWILGIPSSSSHALIGGMVGAVLAGAGFGAIKLRGLEKVIIALFASPLLGFFFGFLLTRLIHFLVQNAPMEINNFFKRGQLVTALAMAFSHGTNDAQKTMGIITLSLLIGGQIDQFRVPLWVVMLSAAAIGLGTALGGWKLIRTLGGRFYKIRPIHSFSTQMTSGAVILAASYLGLPVSTSQVVSSAIIGVGASESFGKVRWSVAEEIVTAWFITIPASALVSAAVYWVIMLFR
ncbi:MAG: inorganic phosphate transporter [Anaerolineaceae bacterium]|nr:MAG: inorganic phosphate transporter [Chloroflexota bacterium]GJQ35649.1 MAG: inorganic phosphate transporter [Anaerolineaceae bacterium]